MRSLICNQKPGKIDGRAFVGRAVAAVGVVAATLLWLAAGLPAEAQSLSSDDRDLYRRAFSAAERDRWEEARALARRADQDLPGKVLAWLDLLREGTGSDFDEVDRFLKDNKDWPSQQGLRYQAERMMPAGMAPARVIAWFGTSSPVSVFGMVRLADALEATGQEERLAKLARSFWEEADLSEGEEKDFRERFRSVIRRQDTLARLDRLLWDGEKAQARRLLVYVDKGYQALAEARMALADMDGGVDGALSRVPGSLQNDTGLTFERLRWRRRKDRDLEAIAILNHPPGRLVRPDLWWQERHIMARRQLEAGKTRSAYSLAAAHGQTTGTPLAQAEFLAGWIALRQLRQTSVALRHFQKLYQAVSSPISRSRGAYWSGRALEAAGDKAGAKKWYDIAAGYPTAFYGQLAAAKLGVRPQLTRESAPSDDAERAFDRRELVRVVRMLNEIHPDDNQGLVARFLRHLAATADNKQEFQLLARLAQRIDRPELAVFVSKRAVEKGFVLIDGGYPRIRIGQSNGIEDALVLSLIRQESTFHAGIVSPAGARGLMQLMPATAAKVADQLGVNSHSATRLTADPAYNIRLGTAYLSDVLDRFNGAYVLGIASYNAGPARISKWIDTSGDPRKKDTDGVVDWIESIPFYETRNYVQRVLEALQVYRALLSTGNTRTLDQDLNR